ncbi:MAG: hypothetical protein Q9182_006612 [Xanthomendoza sp. 2 TL-2023]
MRDLASIHVFYPILILISITRRRLRQLLMKTRLGTKAADTGPRPAPARPTPLQFPQYQARGDVSAAQSFARDFNRFLLEVEKVVLPLHIEGLNITLLGEVPLDRLVPEEYLPPEEWLQDSSGPMQSSSGKQSPAKSSSQWGKPGRKDFYIPARELVRQNDECFDSIPGRLRGKGPWPIRLSYTSKFYQNLLLMAEYWDTSKDNYTTDENGKEFYTGRRYGTGHEMPPHYREDTVIAFVELCVWPFRCNIQMPRSSVKGSLQFHGRHLPIQGILSTVCRSSADGLKARRGILEGPLLGIRCRNKTEFRQASDGVGEGSAESSDLLYEVGAAMLLAQKRAREGKEEEQPWKDQYWSSAKRRHLGELPGGRQDFEANCKARVAIEAAKDGAEPMDGVEMAQLDKAIKKGQRKKTKYVGYRLAYWNTKPPESLWEPKVEYRMIGKEPGAGADNIYLISSLNHHISIVNIRIDDRYLDFITYGSTQPDFDPFAQEWWVLDVKRSKWFDLFDPEDRGQAMRGIWGVMSWMTRDVAAGEENEVPT